jgi:hypothetical protein
MGHTASFSSKRFKSEYIAGILHAGQEHHSLITICLPEAIQNGMLFLQFGHSSLVSGMSNLQYGQGLTPSGSSSCFTGFLAIDSTFF